MYLSYQRVATSATVMDIDQLTVPAEATHAELQADTEAVRYTLDGETDPGNNRGMILPAGGEPKLFPVEDLQNIRFCGDADVGGALNVHYIGRG